MAWKQNTCTRFNIIPHSNDKHFAQKDRECNRSSDLFKFCPQKEIIQFPHLIPVPYEMFLANGTESK
jgi:hypothetical protein